MATKHYRHRLADSTQVKNIHVLKSKQHLDDETYRLVLSGYAKADGTPCTSAKHLTTQQADQLISMWHKSVTACGEKVHLFRGTATTFGTPKQVATIHYYAITCALHYVTFDGSYDIGGGRKMSGEELRSWLKSRFDRKNEKLPPTCMPPIWEWIDNRTKRMLIEGDFIKRPEGITSARMYWRELTMDQAKYLITRWREVMAKLDQRGPEPPALVLQQHLN